MKQATEFASSRPLTITPVFLDPQHSILLKKTKQLDLSSFFSGVQPVKQDVPYDKVVVKVPKPVPKAWAKWVSTFQPVESADVVYEGLPISS